MNTVLSACIELAAAQRLLDRDDTHYNRQRLERAKEAYRKAGGKI